MEITRKFFTVLIAGSLTLIGGSASADRIDSDFCTSLRRGPQGSFLQDSNLAVLAEARREAACMSADEASTKVHRLLGALDRLDVPESGKAIARAQLVSVCLVPNAVNPVAAYAACGHDARLLDKTAFDAEVESLGPGPAERKLLDKLWARATERAADYQAKVAAWRESAPDDARLAVDEVDRLIKAHEAMYAAEPAFAELHGILSRGEVMLLERRIRNSSDPMQLEGCADNRTKLEALVAAAAPKTAEDVRNVFWGSALAWLRMDVEIMCAAVEARFPRAGALLGLGERRSPMYGPRLGALRALTEMVVKGGPSFATSLGAYSFVEGELRTGWMADYAVVQAIDPHVSYMTMAEDAPEDAGQDPHNRLVKLGRIAKIEAGRSDRLRTVSFKKEDWKVPTYSCTRTGKIAMFESDGTPIWDRNCRVTGEETMSVTLATIQVTAEEAAKLKVGQLVKVSMSRYLRPEIANAYVFEVTDGKGKNQYAVSYFEFPLTPDVPAATKGKKGKQK